MNHVLKAVELIRNSKKTIAVTGAGVSTESGIPDFRSADGLWSRYDPMEYGTISAFRRDPEKIWKMLAELLLVVDTKPNSGHIAMARLEEMGMLQGIITQNIDSLHQKAGSRTVVEFHGSFDTFTCLKCSANYHRPFEQQSPLPPRCSACDTVLKPDIVFFDEQIPVQALEWTEELINGAEILIVAGTSCEVIPASLIPQKVHLQGGKIIELNLFPVLDEMAEVVLKGKFTEKMEALLVELH